MQEVVMAVDNIDYAVAFLLLHYLFIIMRIMR